MINDALGARNLVLIGDEGGRSVRAYVREDEVFSEVGVVLKTADGAVWEIEEDALVSGDRRLQRVAGHVAYWFAWSGYLGDVAELYSE